jgi:hypothetical protein
MIDILAPTCKARGRGPQIVMVDVDDLHPSPENSLLYRKRSVSDPDYRKLVQSIRADGIQAPLLISRDDHIVSGHQRWQAAIDSGLPCVPCVRLKLRRSDHTEDQWIAILREHNTGRQKTFDELIREQLVDIDPDKAVAQIVEDRAKRTSARIGTIDIGAKEMIRHNISPEKGEMVDAVLAVLRDLEDYLPVSLRAIHYRLLNREFWRNSKTQVRYLNDRNSYSDLSDLATRLRIKHKIPWDSISDETRPVTTWRIWRVAADFVEQQSNGYLRNYNRDLLQSQQIHFEIVVEKLTIQSFIDEIAGKFCMPVVVMRGNSSIDARHQIVERFHQSGKDKLHLLCMGDCDPDGDSIVDSTLRSLRDDFGAQDVTGVRVAMTHAQADELRLPRMLDAKKTSSNFNKFIAAHGRADCFELDAVEPTVLQGWLDSAIRGVIDIEAYNYEVDQQRADAQEILARRKAILELWKRAGTSPNVHQRKAVD